MTLRNKRILIGVAVALASGALLFFLGWWRGTQVAGARAARIEAARAELERDVEQARRDLASLQGRVTILEARVDCARALEALDDRNFGIAQGHLEHAMERLSGVAAAAEAHRLGGELQLTTASDLADQRLRLRSVCAALDEALSSAPAG